MLLQTVVSLINLGARKAGLGGPEGPTADLEQTRQAIEGARALLPLLEARHGDQLGQVREALSRLQMAFTSSSPARPTSSPEGGGEAPPPRAEGRSPARAPRSVLRPAGSRASSPRGGHRRSVGCVR